MQDGHVVVALAYASGTLAAVRRVMIAALVGALSLFAVQEPVSAVPAITSINISASAVSPGSGFTVSATLAQPASLRLDVFSQCGGASQRSILGTAVSSSWQTQWDGLDASGLALASGDYKVRLAIVDALGQSMATPVEAPFTVLGADATAICANVRQMPTTELLTSALTAFASSSAASAIITTAGDAGYAAIASSYANRFSVPLMLIPNKVSAEDISKLVAALAKRRSKAVLIGPAAAVPTAIETALKLKKLTVVRLAGTDRAETAAEVAKRLKPAVGSPAVYASLGGNPQYVSLAVAYANAMRLPLLAASSVLAPSTAASATALKLSGGVAIGDSREISDDVMAKLPGVTRVIGKDYASTSFALVRALPATSQPLILDLATNADAIRLVSHAASGGLQLLLNGEPSTAVKSWLVARQDIVSVDVSPRIARSTAIGIGRLITDRGLIGALPSLEMKSLPAVSVPAQFTFTGSGFGHGVGMSQWGAYGQAKEGRSAAEILQHYFSGSVVAPINDAVDLNVSLNSRVASESFRLEPLADPNSTLEMSAANGTVQLLTMSDVVTTKYVNGKINVSVTGPTDVADFVTNQLTFKWQGNRDPGSSTGGPAVLRVAGPGVSIANGGRYRYGIVSVTLAKVSGALSLGLQVNNILRLHDEYLYGIAEVGSSWPAAAIQAQIITARSYAYRKYKAGIRSACACHVYDDPRDQNFTGYAKLAERSGSINYGALWKVAVDGTATSASQGQALTVDGQVVSAYYSAASGGKTQNNEDVWGGSPLSYTRSVDDPWSLTWGSSSVVRWVPRSFSQKVVATAFGAPDVAYLEFSDRYASGAVNHVVAVSSSGQRYILGAETFKSRLNAGLSDGEVLAKGIPSVWIWKVDTEIPTSSAAAAAMQLAAGTTSIAAKLSAATSTSLVIVQSPTDAVSNAKLALASAFAGTQRIGLLVNTTQQLDASVKAEFTRRKATKAVIVGQVPSAVLSALTGMKVAVTSLDAPSVSALSAQMATALALPASSPVVLVSDTDASALAIAVSVAVRARQPLLMATSGALSAEVSAYVMSHQPSSSLVVGDAKQIPDATVAGIGAVSRLTTGDLRLASIIAASQTFDAAGTGVVLMNPLAPAAVAVIAAGSGMPLFIVDEPSTSPSPTASPTPVPAVSLPQELLSLVPRMPALTLVFRVGIASNTAMQLRTA